MKRILIKWVGIVTLITLALNSSLAAEQPKAGRLQDYFVRLGYGVADCRKDKINKLLLEGDLAGKKRRFLVDTGWSMTALDETTARGLKTLRQLGVELDDGISYPPTTVLIEKLTLGQSQFLNQPADVRKLEMDYITVEEEGILGLDFLLRNFCLIDCGEAKLYFRGKIRSADELKAMEESLRRSGFIEVSLRSGPGLSTDSQIKDQRVRLLVDTGSYFSILDESQINRLSLRMETSGTPATGSQIPNELATRSIGVGTIGAHKLRVTTLSTLQIGARKWKNPHFGVVNLKSWGINVPGSETAEIQGLLGADMLIKAGALIDCSNNKLWFRPEKP